jgi:hypothetical protein
MSEEGGTKLEKRRPVPQPQQQMQQQAYQIPEQPPTFMQVPQQMPREVQRPTAEELFKQQPIQVPQQMQMPQAIPRETLVEIPKKKSMFGATTESDTFKNAILVAVIFVVLNSKIVWRQIIKLPFMGSVEPSMIALVINSLLAAIAYYIITKFVMK